MSDTQEIKHNFGEKKSEVFGKENLDVWVTDKYMQSRRKAIEMIDSGKYGLEDGDFWILKNKAGSKLAYNGLIISHQGCQKINDHLDENTRFDQQYCSSAQIYTYNGKTGMLMEYRDKRDGCYEIGEISPDNCKNPYEHAMLLKRTFDRVVLVKSKLKFYGIYSEEEADAFARTPEESQAQQQSQPKAEPTKTTQQKPAQPNSNGLTLDEALNYKIRGELHKGQCIRNWINGCKPNMQVRLIQEIAKLKTSSDKSDQTVADCVLNAIREKKLTFPKNTEPQQG